MLIEGRNTFEGHSQGFLSKVTAYIAEQLPSSSRSRTNLSHDNQTVQTRSQSNITTSQVQGRVPVTILRPHGPLDAGYYRELIVKAEELYQAGTRFIILDMSDVPSVSISGMVALHGIAALLRGEAPLDPEAGWATLHAVTGDLATGGLQARFKLLNLQPQVEQLLTQAGVKCFLAIYSDLETAVASF